MLELLALLFPPLLLLLMLAMERVERPLRDEALGDRVVEVLGTHRADDVESYVSEGLESALERYWRRHRLTARLRRLRGERIARG